MAVPMPITFSLRPRTCTSPPESGKARVTCYTVVSHRKNMSVPSQPSSQPALAADDLKAMIREIPDFPKPGIRFYDITTLLKEPTGLRAVIDQLKAHYAQSGVDAVLGIEARGFIFAPALAYALGVGFVP